MHIPSQLKFSSAPVPPHSPHSSITLVPSHSPLQSIVEVPPHTLLQSNSFPEQSHLPGSIPPHPQK